MQTQEEGIGLIGRKKVVPGIVDAMKDNLPPGAVGMIANLQARPRRRGRSGTRQLIREVRSGIDHARPNELKEGLALAQAGL